MGPLIADKLKYGKEHIFSELEDAKKVYYCMILSVGSEARGKGLGTELIKRGYEIAKQVTLFLYISM